jgi:LysM repeat protein
VKKTNRQIRTYGSGAFGQFRERRFRIVLLSVGAFLSLVSIAALLTWAATTQRVDAYGGSASWYDLTGNTTACGDVMDASEYTAASPTYPCGTQLLVSHGGSSVEVVVTDCGPAGWTGQNIDLSAAAGDALGIIYAGQAGVDIQELYVPNNAPACGGGGYSSASASSAASASASASSAASASASASASAGSAASASASASPAAGGNLGGMSGGDLQGSSSEAGIYIVQPGDNPSSIASALGVGVNYLLRMNGLGYYDYIYAGEKLYY